MLSVCTQEVLEKMFFFTPPDEPAAEDDGEPWSSVQVGFEGSPPGELILRIRRRAARSIAADFLATDIWGLTDEQIDGVICELANMICGSVLSRMESPTLFRLHSPCLIQDSEAALAASMDPTAHRIEMFGDLVTVAMTLGAPKWTRNARSEC
jgi:CheY-specific phosphatase CheX